VGQTNISKLLYRAVCGCVWDRQIFQSFYVGPYMAVCGTDKYFKTPIYGSVGQTNISKLLYRAVCGCVWDRQIFQSFYVGPYMAVCGTDKYFKTPI